MNFHKIVEYLVGCELNIAPDPRQGW